jgi:cytochrome c-type biogenesis protein CcmH
MTPLVVIAAALALAGVALLTRSLWRRHGAPGLMSDDNPALLALRRQLAQLTALKESGALGEAPYAEARQALESRIIDAVIDGAPHTASPAGPPTISRALLAGAVVFIGIVAATGYALFGAPQALSGMPVASTAGAGGQGHPVTDEQIEGMVETLAARLKEKPDDAQGWSMLGRSYLVLGRHQQAVPAFQRALALRGDDAVLLADYADALAVVNGRSLEGEPSRLIAKALEIDPSNLKALSLAGTAAFQRKDYKLALKHWEKMAQLEPGNELVQQIQGGIDEARRLAGLPSAAPAAAAPTPKAATASSSAAAAGASVSGTVTLSPSLAGKARPDDTLFVFARAVEGPRMPLAILRKQVKDLPLGFTLDDSMAMASDARLSSASRVIVGARISAQGNAMPQAGDLQGFSAPVDPGSKGLSIQITEVVAKP